MGEDKKEVQELFYKIFTGSVLRTISNELAQQAFDYLNIVLPGKPDAPVGEGATAGEDASSGEADAGFADRPPRVSTYVIPEKVMELEELIRHAKRMEAECVAARKRDMGALKKLYANAVEDVVAAHLGASEAAGEIQKLFADFMVK
jgi:hypothetical protein